MKASSTTHGQSDSLRPHGRSDVGVILALLVGTLAGVGGFTFQYAEGLSYLSNNPKTCSNCHIMNDQFDSWRKGPHHAVATCNDCHVPPQFFSKYLAKGRNGYHHSMGFTFQSSRPDELEARRVFEEPIRIKPTNSQILQDNCLRCHGDMVHDQVAGATTDLDAIQCVHCHASAGHGDATGLGGPLTADEAAEGGR
jgi:cytochrome c nitrite reductase small subunit